MKAARYFGLIVVLTLLMTLSQTMVRDSGTGLAAGTAFTVNAYDFVGNESGQGQGVLGFGENAQGATINAASCEQTDVQAAIDSANPEDTIIVPPGSCTWTSRLDITKGIYLIGAGIGNTFITNGLADHGYLISVDPADYDRNDPIRISGFTFDLNNNGRGIDFGTYNKTAPFTINTKGRIDHNRFYNSPNESYQAIWNRGTIRGVVDNNIFDSVTRPIRSDTGTGNSSWWDNFSVIQYGAADDNLYFEDNIFTGSSVKMGIITGAQCSARYIFRYNTIISDKIGSYPVFDLHGNNGPDAASSFGGEIYGNSIAKGVVYGARILDHRGGKALVFNNYLQAQGAGIQVREEYADSRTPTTGGTMHVNDSYYWGNWVLRRDGLERVSAYIGQDCCDCDPACVGGTTADTECCYNGDDGIKEDIDFFQGKDSFDGTSGVGCGTLAARPATCTVGVGYWATDQSCTDLTGMVGANPATPISGTLYKCTAPNTWEAYFTPYTYPHPLRGESLVLRATPADQTIHLTWQIGASLPPTSTWQIAYDGPTGDQPSPISGIISPTRAYTLTGLTNYTWYTVTLNAMSDSTPFLTDTVRVMPTDIFVYLPIVLKGP